MQLSVRDVDEKTFLKFKAESVRQGMNIGQAITFAMDSWLQKRQKKKLSLLQLEPTHWGKDSKRTSEEMDKLLYG